MFTLSLPACQTAKIPDVNVYKEIPFIDGAEGVAITTVTRKSGFLNTKDWAALKPYLLCVDDKGWAEIKKGWLLACRYAGKNCNVEVDSVATMIEELDKIAEKVYKVVPR